MMRHYSHLLLSSTLPFMFLNFLSFAVFAFTSNPSIYYSEAKGERKKQSEKTKSDFYSWKLFPRFYTATHQRHTLKRLEMLILSFHKRMIVEQSAKQ